MTLEKRRKIGIFPKGLTHGFGENFQNILSVCFSLKKSLNILFEFVLKKKQPFLEHKNDRRKSKIWHFSKGVNPWFWSKF